VHKRNIFLLSIIFFLPGIVWGYPSNQWQHAETEHFFISTNEKTHHLLSEASLIAEQIAATFADYFDEEVIKTRIAIVLQDHHDYSQGESYRDIPLVIIDCRKTDQLWRGDAEWLKNVLAHELGHAYSLRIMQLPILLSLGMDLNSDGKGQEGEFTIHYRHNRLPSWFTEGIAQMASYQMKSDSFDLYREMLLQDAFLNGKLLTLDQMERFEGTSRENELVYNQGFHLMLYLKKNYPDRSIRTLCQHIRSMGFQKGFEICYGKPMNALYLEWMADLKKKYPPKPGITINGTALYPDNHRPLNTEIRSAGNGKFVIANWRHDYHRFDLFEMTKDRKEIQQVIKDTGMILKQDTTTGNIWFNRSIYNADPGVANFDIFMMDIKGRIQQVTHGKRCMAFDVQNNTLVYAEYKNGETTLVLKPEKGSSVPLITFSYHTAVHHVSMITPDLLILSLTEENRKTAAILKNGKLEPIWENIGADVTDCIAATPNRLLFISTISGSPQLYWCDLTEDRFQWYQITHVPGGVRFPTIEFQNNEPVIFGSVFQNGHNRIFQLHQPFSKLSGIDVRAYPHFNGNKHPIQPPESQTGPSEKSFAFVTATPSISAFIGLEETESTIPLTTPTMSTSVSLFGRNAPGNFALNLKGTANKSFSKTFDQVYPTGSIWLQAALWQFKLSETFSFNKIIHEYENSFSYQADLYDEYNLTTILDYQLSNYDYVWFTYCHRILESESRYEYKYSVPYFFSDSMDWGMLYRGNIISLDWQHIEKVSSFSPGRLGQPFFSVNGGMDCLINRYPDIFFQDYEMYYAEKSPVYKFRLGTHQRDTFWQGKISLGFGMDGFTYLGGIENNKVSLYMYDLIGSQSTFSGYPGEIQTRRLLRTYGELRINPFIRIQDATKQIERMHLGIKLEAGIMEYFYYGIESDIPVSLETSYRIFFYVWPDRQSYAYIKCAFPLTDIDTLEDVPSYRLFFGISI
jgi:hypothetical protein